MLILQAQLIAVFVHAECRKHAASKLERNMGRPRADVLANAAWRGAARQLGVVRALQQVRRPHTP